MATQGWQIEPIKRRGKAIQRQTQPSIRQEQKVKVLMADDHAIVLEGLRLTLEAAGMEILATAPDAHRALDLLQQLNPDVLLTDLHMPGMSGLELLRELREAKPDLKVAILTGEATFESLRQARTFQADGFLSKDLDGDSLAEAIGRIAAGERVYQLSQEKRVGARIDEAMTPSGSHLSNQEIEVLRLLAQALDNREIATALVISENTVKSHVSSILAKLGASNRTQAALWALRHQVEAGPNSETAPHPDLNR